MVKRIALLITRLLIGCVFVFSGFVKAIDPLGFTYKMEDYLVAMGPFFEQFAPLAFIAAIVLAAVELVIGVNYIFGVRLKETTWAAALFMLVMTPLTLWIALDNPVHDCGCFGDALIISNWATFWKNIIISFLILVAFLLRKSHRSFIGNTTQWAVTGYAFLFSVALSVYCYEHLPILDFRPYSNGSNILKGMEIPEDAEPDSTITTLTYSKNGVAKDFIFPDYPKNDSTWVFVDSKTEVIKKGYEPPIHDFTIDDSYEGDITDIVLANPSYTFLVVAYDFKYADLSKADQLNKVYEFAKNNGYDFYALTASVDEEIEKFKQAAKAEYPICLTDKITLKTIVRSNPGLVLLKDATVINKWHVNDLPEFVIPLEESGLSETPQPEWLKKIAIVTGLFLVGFFLLIALGKRWKKN